MNEAARSSFAAWSDFYVIVGSSAAALTGLQFVVIALVNDLRAPASEQGVATFSTPTIVHFSMALLTSAIVVMPWPEPWHAGGAAGICGVGSFLYELIVLRRARTQTQYEPVLEDWIWYFSLPMVAYTLLTVSAILVIGRHAWAPFGIAGAVLLMVFVGIHNSWDTVTYIALQNTPDAQRATGKQTEQERHSREPRPSARHEK
jgi:hypothetical protein